MPDLGARVGRLYYDDSCGPCTFLARSVEAVSGHRVRATPLAAPESKADLATMSDERRFGYAHLVVGASVRTGEEAMRPLVGLTLGRTAERVVRHTSLLDRPLRGLYRYLWEYRRRRGCGANSAA